MSCAPASSTGSDRSIDLATVTPSRVEFGICPHPMCIMALRPWGPSVEETALVSFSMPRKMASRASGPVRMVFIRAGLYTDTVLLVKRESMRRLWLLAIFFLILAGRTSGQTIVSGTLADANGYAYSGAQLK